MTTPRFAALWAINASLDQVELDRQLAGFAADGLDGVVFHPRFYPGEPEYLGDGYLETVARTIETAAALGLEFWIYDENGWPSGTVGGRMLAEHPELRQRWLELRPGVGDRTEDAAVLAFERDGQPFRLVERRGDGVDYLAPSIAERFLELCYTRYADGLPRAAFAKVAGFFSDEPEFGLGHSHHRLPAGGAIPWTPDLPGAYAERHGVDLIPLLPALFGEHPHAGEVRERFWELVTDLFAERFLGRIDSWCRERGVRFTAHVKGEEHPLFQVPTVGSLGTVARRIDLPGLDALGRNPGNDFYPRQISSSARQFGDGRCMAEAFGGAGWGAGPADLERVLGWLGRHGVTDFMLHIAQYRLDSAAIEDWPPSQPTHLSWRPAYRELLDRVRAELTNRPRPRADTLVVVPQRGIMRAFEAGEFVGLNVHDAHDYGDTPAGRINRAFLGLVERLHAAGVDYEFADERTVEREGRLVSGELWLGASHYRAVVVADGAVLDGGVLAESADGEPAGGDGLRMLAEAGARLFVAESAEATVSAAGCASADSEASVRSAGPIALDWSVRRLPDNALVIEPLRDRDGRLAARIAVIDYRGEAELHFADEVRNVRWDDVPLDVRTGIDGARAVVTVDDAVHRVHFEVADDHDPGLRPRVWLTGPFRVVGTGEGAPRLRDRLAAVQGGFALARRRPEHDRAFEGGAEATLDGYPFLAEPIELRCAVDLPPGAGWLTLNGGLADAALVTVGDQPARWCWGDRWRVPVDAEGAVPVTLTLHPSAQNRFGPHHHYAGDPHLVSPAQARGDRNYADHDDAPEGTAVDEWMLRRLVVPATASVEGASHHRADGGAAPLEQPLTSLASARILSDTL